MPINPTYPGVYIEELESSVKTIVGVSTSVTAFIGRAMTGVRNKSVFIHSFEDYSREFGGLSKDSNMSYAVYQYFLNDGRDAIIVAIDDGAMQAHFSRELDKDANAVTPNAPGNLLQFTALKPGNLSKNLSVYVEKNAFDGNDEGLINLYVKKRYNPEDFKNIANAKDKVNAWLKGSSPTLESFFRLSLSNTNSRFVYHILNKNSTYIQKNEEFSDPPADAEIDDCLGLYQTDTQVDLDGKPAATEAEEWARIIPTADEDIKAKKGMRALDDADIFNILVIPPLQDKDKNELDIGEEVYESALKYCKDRRAFLLLDPPQDWSNKSAPIDDGAGTSIDKKFATLRDENAAIFFPRLLARDPLDGNNTREIAPCGAVAGVMARTDTERGIWKAPAGISAKIMGVIDLPVKLTDPENGDLNPVGINCIRIKPPAGIVVWGSRTMAGADQLTSQWKYTPVRRLALYIEESLYRGTQWVVFEPNDEPLWSQIRLNVGAFMDDLFHKGAFQGMSPKEAYLVKCDHETTTQIDIDRGIVNIVVGFAPLKPAEFVILRITQLAGQTFKGANV
jgi:uncharacterized protein